MKNTRFFFSLLFTTFFLFVQSQELDETERKRILQDIYLTIEEHYVYPHKAATIINYLKQQEKKKHYANLSHEHFSYQISKDLQVPYNDSQMALFYDTKSNIISDSTLNFPQTMLDKAGVNHNFGMETIKILPGNIAYMQYTNFSITPFVSEAKNTIDASMSFIKNSDALILDLRGNRGGDMEVLHYFISYFFEQLDQNIWEIYSLIKKEKILYYTKKVTGPKYLSRPIYVLINEDTFGEAEAFAYTLKQFGMATIIGKTSEGGAYPLTYYPISDKYCICIPSYRMKNAITQTDWHQIGVLPEHIVANKDMLATSHRMVLDRLYKNTNELRYKRLRIALEPKNRDIELANGILEQYYGVYHSEEGAGFSVFKRENHLVLKNIDSGISHVLLAVSPNTFIANQGGISVSFNCENKNCTRILIEQDTKEAILFTRS